MTWQGASVGEAAGMQAGCTGMGHGTEAYQATTGHYSIALLAHAACKQAALAWGMRVRRTRLCVLQGNACHPRSSKYSTLHTLSTCGKQRLMPEGRTETGMCSRLQLAWPT